MAIQADQISKPARKLRKLLRKLPKRPSPEEVHDLRTNSRRVEANLSALALDSGRNGKRLLKHLSKLRSQAGKVRDIDVLTGFAANTKNRNGQDDDENDCFVQLLEYLGGKRQKSARKLYAAAQRYGSQLRARLKRTEKDIKKSLPAVNKSGSDNNNANGRHSPAEVAASALKLVSDLSNPPRLNRTNLHPYRLQVKELRNVLLMADAAKQQAFVRDLGEVKDAIGEWHDWSGLVAIAKDVLSDHGTQCGVTRELNTIAEEKYQKALRMSEAMRTKYIHAARERGKKSSRSMPRPTEPVWSATAELIA